MHVPWTSTLLAPGTSYHLILFNHNRSSTFNSSTISVLRSKRKAAEGYSLTRRHLMQGQDSDSELVASCMNIVISRVLRPESCRIHMLTTGGWEHTATVFSPFPGFQAVEEYPEYSSDFFDGKHSVLRGASPYTGAAAARTSFRNFYQDVYPHVFAKFRCCAL